MKTTLEKHENLLDVMRGLAVEPTKFFEELS